MGLPRQGRIVGAHRQERDVPTWPLGLMRL